jgi:hypothetical protein
MWKTKAMGAERQATQLSAQLKQLHTQHTQQQQRPASAPRPSSACASSSRAAEAEAEAHLADHKERVSRRRGLV